MTRNRPTLPGSEKDRLFASEEHPVEFRFDAAVARVFPDMVRRSIPGYATLLHLIGVHAGHGLPELNDVSTETRIYDLGCSLGACSLAVRHALGPRPARIIAVDASPAMVEKCRQVVDADGGLCEVEVHVADITTLQLRPCALVILNFTLQFADKAVRSQVIQHIAKSLVPGGSLILSEKTASPDVAEERFYQSTHDAFRQDNGYSELELSRKRQALENVLQPEFPRDYEQMMIKAGLTPLRWFQCLGFISWVAYNGAPPRAAARQG